MSSVHIPRAISHKGRTSYDLDRENFEKTQTVALQKAINVHEVALKEKHARRVIMGTYQERGASMFWTVVLRFPLQGNPIVCWKFCQVLHKLWRDGHPNTIRESSRYAGFLTDLGKLWGHLKDHQGRLIANYTKLLVQKINFHKKYPEVAGNLVLEEGQLEKICNHDINTYFEMSVDVLDYMDDILNTQAAVFGSLDMSRANSMTSVGQCRLAPLIPCILDSCQLYDTLVKLLFKLHSSLPPDTLTGHRDRFYKQYKNLKRFYFNSSNLQYFKNLIKVPSLPEEPPNFLVASDLSSHVKPEAVVEEPEPEPDDAPVDTLVETASTSSSEEPQHNSPDERDIMIQQLMSEVTRLREEIQHLSAENQMMVESLQNQLRELEMELTELKQVAESTQQENEDLRTALREGEKNQDAAGRLAVMEKIARTNDDKYKKIKDMYARIKDEHVKLLRNHADLSKQLASEKKSREDLEEEQQKLSTELMELQREKCTVEASLQQTSADSAAELTAVTAARQQVEEQKQSLESQLEQMSVQREEAQSQFQTVEEEKQQALTRIKALEVELMETNQDRSKTDHQLDREQQSHEESKQKIQSLESQLEQMSVQKEEAQSQFQTVEQEKQQALTRIKEITDQLSALGVTQAALQETLHMSQKEVDQLRNHFNQTSSEKDKLEQELKREIIDYRQRMLVSAIEEGQHIISEALAQAENPHHTTITCTAEYLIDRTSPLLDTINQFRASVSQYSHDNKAVSDVVKNVCDFSHRVADTVVLGYATSHAAPIEEGEALSAECRSCGEESLQLLSTLRQENLVQVGEEGIRIDELVRRILAHAETLLPKVEDVKAGEIGDLVDQEMLQTTQAIEKAAAKIADMLAQSREKYTGIQLQVNEGILDSCNALMRAIMKLVEKSKNLQREIVVQGRGTASAKEFYKKHHRWTEGLISAAKAVGWGANVLVEAADKAVRGEGNFEQLMVCSQEIAASTTQLVVSSKVKAQRGSENLTALADASRDVSQCTGQVVASAKSAIVAAEEQDAMDFSKLTLHQSKRLEMESQVKVIQLETELEGERRRLGELRKTHYRLAGESEGWEQDESVAS